MYLVCLMSLKLSKKKKKKKKKKEKEVSKCSSVRLLPFCLHTQKEGVQIQFMLRLFKKS